MQLAQSAARVMQLGTSILPAVEQYLHGLQNWLVNPQLARDEEHRQSMLKQAKKEYCGFCSPDEEIKGQRLDQEGSVGIWQNSWPHPNARQGATPCYRLDQPGEHYLIIPQSETGVRHPLHFAELSLEALTNLLSLAANAAGDGNAVFFMRFGEREASTATQGHLHAQVKVLDDNPSDRMITGCSVNCSFNKEEAVSLEIRSLQMARAGGWCLLHWEGGMLTHPEVERWYCFQQKWGGCESLEHLLQAEPKEDSLGTQLFQLMTYALLISPLAYRVPPVPGGIVIIRQNHRHGQLEAHCLQLKEGHSYILNL